ncbi:hypothetical protein LC087_19035 (plasmid) [Bacillus carboniphilus]|uniref:Phage protein n=1 Tax=Bacillus carboniphilus TaxID=86663 RepID=A0ABY9K1C8_9BACI|nr:hypothetical protein [Bacillus carboniphilus]WLR44403.1 hypothetical protein LC087_19035 [Bacillus carboniphilus]
MKFDYKHKGDILCKREEYTFRYLGNHSATIYLSHLLEGNGVYAFDFKLEDTRLKKHIPQDFKHGSSVCMEIYEKYGYQPNMNFETKEEALQRAIDVVTDILTDYTDIPEYVKNMGTK